MWIRCAYHGHEECPKEEEIEPGEHNDQSSRGLARLLAEDGDVGVGVGLRFGYVHVHAVLSLFAAARQLSQGIRRLMPCGRMDHWARSTVPSDL